MLNANKSDLLRLTAIGQAGYFIVTGLWSLLGIKSFQKITGPKTDIWLVKTVGVLVIAIGAALGMAGVRRNASAEIPVLGAGSAAALGAIDVVYVARGRISPIYLLDAVAEAGIIGMWALGWKSRESRTTAASSDGTLPAYKAM